jgi:hypothetical protein
MNNLKAIARAYKTPEGVSFYFIPYQTILVHVAIEEMKKIDPNQENWDVVQQTISMCMPLLVDIEFPEQMSVDYQGFQYYWQNRNGDFSANYELYKQLTSFEVCTDLWQGFTATRDHVLEAPEDLQASADPNDEPATRKRSKN